MSGQVPLGAIAGPPGARPGAAGPKAPGAGPDGPGSGAGPTAAPAAPLALAMLRQPVSEPGQGVVVTAALGGTMKVVRYTVTSCVRPPGPATLTVCTAGVRSDAVLGGCAVVLTRMSSCASTVRPLLSVKRAYTVRGPSPGASVQGRLGA